MKKFYIPIRWTVNGSVIVAAENIDEATSSVYNDFASYIPDDFTHDFESVEINMSNAYEVID